MNKPLDAKGELAVELLKIFPPSLSSDVVEDAGFRERYGLQFDATVTFNTLGISVKRSALYPAIRVLFGNKQSTAAIETTDKRSAELSLDQREGPRLFLTLDGKSHEIPTFWMLSDDARSRLSEFEEEIGGRNLPTDTIEAWREKVAQRPLSDDEIDDLREELRLIPQEVAQEIREEFTKPDGSISVIVPRKAAYYRGLIGDRGGAAGVEEFASGNARAQIARLLKWNFRRGLAQCLLFCANPRLSALVDISDRAPEDVTRFYEWLANDGDRWSQIAGLEIGLRSLPHFPTIEPLLLKIVESIRDEDTSDKAGRLSLAANLFIFVDGELARTRVFADAPPYWRRLAATAQAAVIERTVVAAGGAGEDSTEWAVLRGQEFFMQTLTDLREEPRWLPDLMSAKQLRLELLMRARIAGHDYKTILPAGALSELLLGENPNALAAITSAPSAYAPSPIEGGTIAPKKLPDELLGDLRAPIQEKSIEARIFAGVVNYSQTFHFDSEIAALIAGILRKVQYRLSLGSDSDIGFPIIMGLASIAASARHPDLADELRILTRVLTRRGDLTIDAEGRLRIALLACASRRGKTEWCKAVGDWLLEIANGEFEKGEAARIRSHLRILWHAVPELVHHTSKVDAALASIAD